MSLDEVNNWLDTQNRPDAKLTRQQIRWYSAVENSDLGG